jgi:hypothetical protein
MWAALCSIHTQYDLLWMVAGDFNECLWSFEQFSTTLRAKTQMSPFRDALEVYGLVDLGFSGVPHTYDIGRIECQGAS